MNLWHGVLCKLCVAFVLGNKLEQELNSMGQISKLQILEGRVFDFIRILDGNQLLLCMCVCIEPFMLFC